MKATITKQDHGGKIRQNRKESHFTNEYAVLVDDKQAGHLVNYNGHNIMKAVVVARIYATKSTVYACVWINSSTYKNRKGVYLSGGGKAGGYGYHRASAALQAALDDAGIVLTEAIDGRGESAMFDALAATAKALGYRKFHIHEAHG